MAKIVFILGAGASREAGGPLMYDFLDRAREIGGSGKVGGSQVCFQHVVSAIGRLQKVHSKADLDLYNIESVFAAFETADILGRIDDYAEPGRDLLQDIRTVMGLTVDISLGAAKGKFPPYDRFVQLVNTLLERGRQPAILSFNYDLCLERHFQQISVRLDNGMSEEPIQTALPLLKLHGSLGWGYCKSCGGVTDSGVNALSPKPINCRHCPERAFMPFLIPPTLSKGGMHRQLASVWRRAAFELKDATDIVVIGYSLPTSDEFFRHLYAIGTVGVDLIRSFLVVDPDETGTVEKRFRDLLGPGAERRFKYERSTFSRAVNGGVLSHEYPFKYTARPDLL